MGEGLLKYQLVMFEGGGGGGEGDWSAGRGRAMRSKMNSAGTSKTPSWIHY